MNSVGIRRLEKEIVWSINRGENPASIISKVELKSLIKLKKFDTVGLVFGFTPIFFPDGSFDWRSAPKEMAEIMTSREIDLKILHKPEKEEPLKLKRFREMSFEIQEGICFYCRKNTTYDHWCIDHITPKSKGGSGSIFNKIGCCRKCNSSKSSMSIIAFIKSRRKQHTTTTTERAVE